ncbi:hypothetical protein RX914_10995 [Pseudomonas syringae pv. actinidiae]|nr:hypothetical protein [Pseudomonas syringae pv. actinidiae]MDU8256600.1 hypothetical protein [Pseudomonas syringae pv. actinidiae]MDU8261178.1 hypothetical protein [Pseudomonas syringae pv. actinidiae]MDU8294143.1 hypothetical protein [Pseudomonas syringae pv. actinidiae]MDU8310063.1 hypothetical protein [Pseudomonas syringae pv. actinidiae]
MNKFRLFIPLLLLLIACSSRAESVTDDCGIETVIIDGQEQRITKSTSDMCRQNLGLGLLNSTYESDNVADFSKKVGSPDGGVSLTTSPIISNTTSTIIEFLSGFFMYAALIVGLYITTDGLLFAARNGYYNGNHIKKAIFAVIVIVVAQPFIGTNINYLITKLGLISGNKTYTAVRQKEDIQEVKKEQNIKMIGLNAITSANSLIAIALEEKQTKKFKDAMAYAGFSKDYSDGGLLSFVEYDLSFKDLVDRLAACSIAKPKYITETSFNAKWLNLDFSFTTENTAINFSQVDECEDSQFYYRQNVYGYNESEYGSIHFSILNPEENFFSTEMMQEKYPTMKKFAEINSNYAVDFSDKTVLLVSNSPIKQKIISNINNSLAIDITKLGDEALQKQMYSQCSDSTDEALEGMAKTLNKTKYEMFAKLTNSCRDAMYGQNRSGKLAIKELWKLAQETANEISKFGCGLKSSGDRLAAKANANSSSPFSDDLTQGLTPSCFYFDDSGIRFSGILTQREEAESLKKIQLNNNLIAAIFYNAEMGRFKKLLDNHNTTNTKDMTQDDIIKMGQYAAYDDMLTSDDLRDKRSALFDYNSTLVPQIVSNKTWYAESNFVNQNVIFESQNVTQEKIDSINMPTFKLTDFLNSGDAILTGKEFSTVNGKQNQDKRITSLSIAKFFDEILFSFSTPWMNRSKGLDGDRNIALRIDEASLKRGLLPFNGSNTFVYAFFAGIEVPKSVITLIIGLTVVENLADLASGMVDNLASLTGGASDAMSGFSKLLIKAGGSLLEAFKIFATVVKGWLWPIVGLAIIGLGIQLWITIEYLSMLYKLVFQNIIANALIAGAFLKSSWKGDNSAIEYTTRKVVHTYIWFGFVGLLPVLTCAIFVVVNVFLWAYTCDILNDISAGLNPFMAIVFKLFIFMIAEIETCLALIITLSLTNEFLNMANHYLLKGANVQSSDSLDAAKGMGAGTYIGAKLTEKRNEAAQKLQKLKALRG